MILPFPPPKNPIHPYYLLSLLLLISTQFSQSATTCKRGCDLALGSYYVVSGDSLTNISTLFSTTVKDILQYNPNLVSGDQLPVDSRINISLSTCDCINDTFLGHTFRYTTQVGDTYHNIANNSYRNLTSAEWLSKLNSYPPINIPPFASINVTINCSCGNKDVSSKYGLFSTYPLREGQDLKSVAEDVDVPGYILQEYNPGVNFANGSGFVFVPAQDTNGTFPSLRISNGGISHVGVAGIAVAAFVVALFLVCGLYFCIYRRRKILKRSLLQDESEARLAQQRRGSTSKASVDSSTGPTSALEFSYEELSIATNNFDLSNKIGQGGFGAVYYAELRGHKAAIKKMRMKASNEFLAELKVLTNVNHMNLVRILGFCADRSLFLVYQFIENGNLSQHLRDIGRDPLPWPTRVQIALDSARGLEYIHEHTVPVYVHRDIKSANILIDQNFHAKVADFGLARLTEGENGETMYTEHAVGTRGYMPPEYIEIGSFSPKTDVYAFGVVLFELISAKEAVVMTTVPTLEYRKLADLFDDALSKPDADVHLRALADERLGDQFLLDSVHKMALLAKACTQDEPTFRPTMRSVVVALAMLSSETENWDIGLFVEQPALRNLMSGR